MTDPDRNQMTGDEDEVRDQELLATLAAVNPVQPADVPGPDSPQARALFQEITMDTTTRGWRRPALVATLAAGLAAAVITSVALLTGDQAGELTPIATDDPTGGTAPPPMAGMCAELYSLETLPARDFAFDGTLTAIDGELVTFDVHEVFKGELDETVTFEGASSVVADSLVSIEGAGLEVGDRALVSGSDEFVWGCGFTVTWDEATASAWRDALG